MKPGPPRLLSAPDKFRGSLSGAEFCLATAGAARESGWEELSTRLSDGGEGFVEVISSEGRDVAVAVTGPLGEPVDGYFRRLPAEGARRAVIEAQSACGLLLAGGAEHNDPLGATTTGVGQLIAAAISAGAEEVVVGCGGSASTDGGRGALEALGCFPPAREASLRIRLVAAYDVSIPFREAAERFSPQKGADRQQVLLLEERLDQLASLYESARKGVTVRPGSGAAGGLAGGLAAVGAELASGFELAAEAAALSARLGEVDAVVTGEGSIDASSLEGKVVGGLLRKAAGFELPVLVIAGRLGEPGVAEEVRALGGSLVVLSDRFGESESLRRTGALVRQVTAEWLSQNESLAPRARRSAQKPG